MPTGVWMVQRDLAGGREPEVVGLLRLLDPAEPVGEGGPPLLRGRDHHRAGQGVPRRRGGVQPGGGRH